MSAVVVGLVFLVVAAAGYYTAAVDRAAARQQEAVPAADPLAASIEAAQQRLTDVPGRPPHLGAARLGLRRTGPGDRGPVVLRQGRRRPAAVAGPPAGGQRRRAGRAGGAGQRPARLHHGGGPGRAGAGDQRLQRHGMGRPDRCADPARGLRRGDRGAAADAGPEAGAGLVHPGVLRRGTARRPGRCPVGAGAGAGDHRRWGGGGLLPDPPGRPGLRRGRPRGGRRPVRRRSRGGAGRPGAAAGPGAGSGRTGADDGGRGGVPVGGGGQTSAGAPRRVRRVPGVPGPGRRGRPAVRAPRRRCAGCSRRAG